MATKRGCIRQTTPAPAQPLGSSPALGLSCGANEHAPWRPGGDDDDNGDNGSSDNSNTRGRTPDARGDEMTMCGGDEAREYATNNADAGARAEQFACTEAALWVK